MLATFTVSNVLDAGAGSLRDAVNSANATAGADVIDFGTSLGGQTIALTSAELLISESVQINASALVDGITIDASGADATPGVADGMGIRIFNIDNNDYSKNLDVSITGMTLTGGDVAGDGGAIRSQESLNLTDVEIDGNFATEYGGGIASRDFSDFDFVRVTISGNQSNFGGGMSANQYGNRTGQIEDSIITGNTPTGFDGRISGGFDLNVLNSTISDNTGRGFSIYTESGSIATLTSSNFTNNGGGGISISSFVNSSVRIDDSIVSDNGGGIGISTNEAGILITNSTISNNAGGSGVTVSGYEYGSVEIRDSVIAGNSATRGGGAYGYLAGGTQLKFIRTLLTDNTADVGGAIQVALGDAGLSYGSAEIIDSTISGNTANVVGGGIKIDNRYTFGSGKAFIVNSTVSGNVSAGSAGGIAVESYSAGLQVEILYSTVAFNLADSDGSGDPTDVAGGIYSYGVGTPQLSHTIVANNTRGTAQLPDDVVGGVVSNFGLFKSNGAGGNINGTNNLFLVDPLLGGLTNNGGPTPTHALLPGSPAIDSGDPSLVSGMGDVPEFDQRSGGFSRIAGGTIDRGAFEVNPAPDGDFNDDSIYDCLDIDALVAEIAAATNSAAFDMTGDGSVDLDDRDAWLAEAGAANLGPGKVYLLGDASLDGVVDGQDFIEWNANKFTQVAAWCKGDFTADGVVDGQDFIIWNANKFQSSDTAVQLSSTTERRAVTSIKPPTLSTVIPTEYDSAPTVAQELTPYVSRSTETLFSVARHKDQAHRENRSLPGLDPFTELTPNRRDG